MKTRTEIKREKAKNTALAYQKTKTFQGEIEWKDLKGKVLEFVDLELKIRIERVIGVNKSMADTEDTLGFHHKVGRVQAIGAYSRRGSLKLLKVK